MGGCRRRGDRKNERAVVDGGVERVEKSDLGGGGEGGHYKGRVANLCVCVIKSTEEKGMLGGG